MKIVRQVALPVIYKEIRLEAGYRIDLLVEDLIVVENKAVERILPVYEQQVLSYLRLMDLKLGLLINFNVTRLVDGVHRVINGTLD